MGASHRTAARLVSRGTHNGKAAGRLAMDTLDVTGQVMTGSLNAVITDSSPGMAAYVTGQKNANNQEGVFPDNTADFFDNPRIEYLGEILRRTRGAGFNVGIVTTADLTDSTPAANAAHTSSRYAGPGIAAQFFDERKTNGVTVLMGGGANHFSGKGAGGTRADDRNLAEEFAGAGYETLRNGTDVRAVLEPSRPAPKAILGLFHQSHMVVAFDKVGAGRYSDELALEKNAAYRDTPMLEDMTKAALRSLSSHSPAGFYLMVEGASIDKRAHAADQERSIWDTIEFDRAVAVALEFAKGTNTDRNPDNDTLVIVTADHESGGMAIIGVGNEHYVPSTMGKAVRDYAGVFRFLPEQVLPFTTNYVVDERGFPWIPTRRASCCSGGPRPRITSRTGPPIVSRPKPPSSTRRTTGDSWRWPIRRGRKRATSRDSSSPARSRTVKPGARPARLPVRHRIERAHVCRAHGHRRAVVGDGTWRLAVHGRLREHGRVAEDAAGGGWNVRPR